MEVAAGFWAGFALGAFLSAHLFGTREAGPWIMRECPQCKAPLRKKSWAEKWRCAGCGWEE